jgi:uncharacterized membrane protein YdbT with pleckstrin-like domain
MLNSAQLPLEEGEQIIMVCRKHWLTYSMNAFILLAIFVLPYLAYRLLGIDSVLPLTDDKSYQLAVFFYAGYFLILWAYFFVTWTNIYLDAWIITDRRMIDVEQQRLFHRSVSDFRIEKIENVTVRELGVIANFFGYGSLQVETAGERIELTFDFLPNPYKVRDIINDCHSKCLARMEANGISPAMQDLLTK